MTRPAPHAPPADPGREAAFLVLSLAAFLAAAWLALWPATARPATLLATGPEAAYGSLPTGDQAFFLYALWWVPHGLLELQQSPWTTPYLGAPEGLSLIDSTLAPLLGLLTAPLSGRAHGLLAYNLWLWLGAGLTAFLASRLARRLGAGRGGAMLAGALLLYPPILRAQLGHLNIYSVWPLLAAYLAWLRFAEAPSARRGLLLGLALASCLYVSAYHTVHLALLLWLDGAARLWRLWHGLAPHPARRGARALALLLLLFALLLQVWWGIAAAMACLVAALGWALPATALWRCGRLRRVAISLVPGLLLAAALAAPYLLALLGRDNTEAQSLRMRTHTRTFFAAQLPHYLLPERAIEALKARDRLGGDDFWAVPSGGEFAVFPGWTLWALFLAGAWARRRRDNPDPPGLPWGFWPLAAACFALLSMGSLARWGPPLRPAWLPGAMLSLPGAVFDRLPLLEGYRVFARMGLMVQLALVLGAATAWPALAARLPGGPGARRLALATLFALALVEGRHWPQPVLRPQMPAAYAPLAQTPPRSLLVCEIPQGPGQFLYPLAIHRQRLVNFYASRQSPALRRRLAQNAFLNWLIARDHHYPALLPPPPPGGMARVEADLGALGIDAFVVHRHRLGSPAQATTVETLLRRCGYRPASPPEQPVLLYRRTADARG